MSSECVEGWYDNLLKGFWRMVIKELPSTSWAGERRRQSLGHHQSRPRSQQGRQMVSRKVQRKSTEKCKTSVLVVQSAWSKNTSLTSVLNTRSKSFTKARTSSTFRSSFSLMCWRWDFMSTILARRASRSFSASFKTLRRSETSSIEHSPATQSSALFKTCSVSELLSRWLAVIDWK